MTHGPLYFADSPCGCRSKLANIATALEAYSSEHGGAYPETLKALTPVYLERPGLSVFG